MSRQIDKTDNLGGLAADFVPGEFLPLGDRRPGRREVQVGSGMTGRNYRVALR